MRFQLLFFILPIPPGVTVSPFGRGVANRDETALPEEQALVSTSASLAKCSQLTLQVQFFTEAGWQGKGTYAGNITHVKDCIQAPDNTSSYNILKPADQQPMQCTFAE
jgi:hypothetical protein